MSIRKLAALAAAALLTLPVHAQQEPAQKPAPNPEQMRQMMQATMGAMIPVMGQMTEAVIEAQLSAAAKPETAERIATFKKNLYDSLLKKGFTPEQSLQIVLATAPPSASPGSK